MQSTSFVPRILKQWIHPDTILLGTALTGAACVATYLGVRTLFNHTDVTLGKENPWKWSKSAQNKKVLEIPMIRAGKIEATTDRNNIAKY